MHYLIGIDYQQIAVMLTIMVKFNLEFAVTILREKMALDRNGFLRLHGGKGTRNKPAQERKWFQHIGLTGGIRTNSRHQLGKARTSRAIKHQVRCRHLAIQDQRNLGFTREREKIPKSVFMEHDYT